MEGSRSEGRSGGLASRRARFGARYEGHDIEVVVEGSGDAADRTTVLLDGRPVEPPELAVTGHDLALTTGEGIEVRLRVDGRAFDVLMGVRLRRADGYWIDLRERSGDEGPG
ncbi:hypothetical protein AB0L40_00060 [Patulibacter sp. NPDC049589]|uniref:hypothetical protein n=1 Tax=Patulibacter sp. NPDC049589 TaxID=3154731 RepID=UPI003439CC09